jgi:hypothetical protein
MASEKLRQELKAPQDVDRRETSSGGESQTYVAEASETAFAEIDHDVTDMQLLGKKQEFNVKIMAARRPGGCQLIFSRGTSTSYRR